MLPLGETGQRVQGSISPYFFLQLHVGLQFCQNKKIILKNATEKTAIGGNNGHLF